MDTDHAPHHVTSWYCVVQISVVTIDPATVEAVVQTHSCEKDSGGMSNKDHSLTVMTYACIYVRETFYSDIPGVSQQ